jgi:hypothetical protein
MLTNNLNKILEKFDPVSLDELNQLRLMNRIDSKFVLPVDKLIPLINRVTDHYRVLEIDGKRAFLYHTEYLDSPKLDFYHNHQNQRLNRFKIRYRTYQTGTSFLEIKRKTNKGKTLKSRIEVTNGAKFSEDQYHFIDSVVTLDKHNLKISSTNHFNRITLASFETNERITLDFGLMVSDKDGQKSLPHIAIAEVKREKLANASPFTKALKELNIYSRGFSKYCMGMALLNPGLKQNSFKPNLLYIKKLNYALTD